MKLSSPIVSRIQNNFRDWRETEIEDLIIRNNKTSNMDLLWKLQLVTKIDKTEAHIV